MLHHIPGNVCLALLSSQYGPLQGELKLYQQEQEYLKTCPPPDHKDSCTCQLTQTRLPQYQERLIINHLQIIMDHLEVNHNHSTCKKRHNIYNQCSNKQHYHLIL